MRHAYAMGFVTLLALVAGCADDHYATMIVQPDTGYGKLQAKLVGSASQLQARHRIDWHGQIQSTDKTLIDTWVVNARPPKGPLADNGSASRGTVVLLHGLGDSKASYLGAAQKLADKGYDVVLPDLPGHGDSTGYVTYGACEKYYLTAVMDYLTAQKKISGPLYVFGVSLGGTVAVQYAAADPRVQGVLAVAPYKDAQSMARLMLRPIAPMMSQANFERVLLRAGDMAHFNPETASGVQAAAKLRCPLVVVYGMLDLSVPTSQSQAVYDAAPQPKKLIAVTPGPEQLALGILWDAWIADQMDTLARNGLKAVSAPATQPGK